MRKRGLAGDESGDSLKTDSSQEATIEDNKKSPTRSSTGIKRKQTTLFSFEERFKAFVGLKVVDNMELL